MTITDRIDAAVAAALPIPGWMHETELHYLAQRATTCRAILEVGSFMGRSTKCMAVALPADGVLYSVDSGIGEAATPVDAHELRGAFVRNLLPEFATGKVIAFTVKSAGFAELVRRDWLHSLTAFDFAFLDGSHLYEDVLRDIDDYWPLVKTGGVLAGHDFQLTDVHRAVMHRFPQARCAAGSIWEVERGT